MCQSVRQVRQSFLSPRCRGAGCGRGCDARLHAVRPPAAQHTLKALDAPGVVDLFSCFFFPPAPRRRSPPPPLPQIPPRLLRISPPPPRARSDAISMMTVSRKSPRRVPAVPPPRGGSGSWPYQTCDREPRYMVEDAPRCGVCLTSSRPCRRPWFCSSPPGNPVAIGDSGGLGLVIGMGVRPAAVLECVRAGIHFRKEEPHLGTFFSLSPSPSAPRSSFRETRRRP